MKNVFVCLFTTLSLTAHAEIGGWVTRDGKPVPNSDAMKSINGFGGWLVVTPDSDWEAKWNTSPETIPSFSEAKDVSYGEKLTILTFYINPKTNASSEIDVLCDIKVTRPDGRSSVNAKGVKCAAGKLQGDPRNVRLTSTVIKYIGERGDPPGKWIVEVRLTDKVRGTAIPLKTHFNLRSKANNHINSDAAKNAAPVSSIVKRRSRQTYYAITSHADGIMQRGSHEHLESARAT